jgi:glucose dehydrogenase
MRQLHLAALIALVFFAGGVVLILLGKEVYGLAVLVAEIAGVVLALYKRSKIEAEATPTEIELAQDAEQNASS